MKIDTVVLACDTNPIYFDLIDVVAKAWKCLVGFRVVVILIGDELPHESKYVDEYIDFKPIEGISTAYQAQCIRLLYPALLDGTIVISDMDMLPCSKEYFDKDIDGPIVFRDGVVHQDQVAMCYFAARGVDYQCLFDIRSVDDVRKRLTEWLKNKDKLCVGSKDWYIDQCSLKKALDDYSGNIVRLTDSETGFRRLEGRRSKGLLSKNPIVIQRASLELRAGLYTDYHMARSPKKMYEDINMEFIDALLNK